MSIEVEVESPTKEVRSRCSAAQRSSLTLAYAFSGFTRLRSPQANVARNVAFELSNVSHHATFTFRTQEDAARIKQRIAKHHHVPGPGAYDPKPSQNRSRICRRVVVQVGNVSRQAATFIGYENR